MFAPDLDADGSILQPEVMLFLQKMDAVPEEILVLGTLVVEVHHGSKQGRLAAVQVVCATTVRNETISVSNEIMSISEETMAYL